VLFSKADTQRAPYTYVAAYVAVCVAVCVAAYVAVCNAEYGQRVCCRVAVCNMEYRMCVLFAVCVAVVRNVEYGEDVC